MEVELQYVYFGEAPPVVPTRLADLELAGSDAFRLTDTYFDTEELALRLAGCSLRVRVSDSNGRPELTWKGRSRRHKSGKRRLEVQLPISEVPDGSEALAALLDRHGIDRLISKASKINGTSPLRAIGQITNERSRHTYVQGLHRLELTWDQLDYPVGPRETRLEVEVKSKLAERFLARAQDELLELFGKNLDVPLRGKVRELCTRLYPELLPA